MKSDDEIMCVMEGVVSEVSQYLGATIGEKVTFSPLPISALSKLPVGLAGAFELYVGRVLGDDVVLAYTPQVDAISPKLLQKQLLLLEQKVGHLVILVVEKIASYNVQRLAHFRVNFIIPGKQMFLPALLVNFRREQKIGGDLTEEISPTAQVLLLYHLQVSSVHGMDAREVAKVLSVSYSSANRAIRWLSAKGLLQVSQGKTKRIKVHDTREVLWKRALSFLMSPIARVVYTDQEIQAPKSGINALAKYTMLNPEARECYALSKAELKALSIPVNAQYGHNVLEVWCYSPALLSDTDTVDKLSLYLSLCDMEDERIQIELDRLLRSIWSEE